MGTRYEGAEGDGRFFLSISGDLLAEGRGDWSLLGVEEDALIPLTCASFSGVSGAGASQISTSSELSESSSERTFGSG